MPSFNSLEAVRKHMVAKSHCKVHYGDGGDDEEVELEEFYDYSSRFMSPSSPLFFLSFPNLPDFTIVTSTDYNYKQSLFCPKLGFCFF